MCMNGFVLYMCVLAKNQARLRLSPPSVICWGEGCELSLPVVVWCVPQMIHVASLTHDDVIDKADTRRGAASINAKFGNKVTCLWREWSAALSLACI
mgnify:CR=1 FL=1